MDVFYKGEDISLTMGLFEDEAMKFPIEVALYDIDVVLYTSSKGSYILASTGQSSSGVSVESVSENTIKVNVTKEALETLSCGQVNIEVRLTDKISGNSKIVKDYAFALEDTIVKKM